MDAKGAVWRQLATMAQGLLAMHGHVPEAGPARDAGAVAAVAAGKRDARHGAGRRGVEQYAELRPSARPAPR